jgi:hypothetical protein
MKIKKGLKLHPISRLKDGSYLAYVKGKIEVPDQAATKRKRYQKHQVLVRVIDFKIRGMAHTRLITNVLDESISAKELVIQYHQRWEIEIGYFEIKTVQCATLRGQSPTLFRSKRSDLARQELYAILIIYNLIRYKMLQAAEKEGVDPRVISFLDAMHWIIDVSAQLFDLSSKRRQQILQCLLHTIAQSRIDRPRRKRRNPRVIKQRSSSFPLKKAQRQGEVFDLDQLLEIIEDHEQLPIFKKKEEQKMIEVDFAAEKILKNMKNRFFEKVIHFIKKRAA